MNSMQNILLGLFEKAKDRMSEGELQEVSCLTELAADEAQRISDLCMGLGCLVSTDGLNRGAPAGNFQDAGSVSSLLFSLSHSLDVIAAMAKLGAAAEGYESQREAQGVTA